MAETLDSLELEIQVTVSCLTDAWTQLFGKSSILLIYDLVLQPFYFPDTKFWLFIFKNKFIVG